MIGFPVAFLVAFCYELRKAGVHFTRRSEVKVPAQYTRVDSYRSAAFAVVESRVGSDEGFLGQRLGHEYPFS